jgi:uncharacterized protein YeaO (DUF488 family)
VAKIAAPTSIRIARVYDLPPKRREYRVLIDRVWPRGVKKEALCLDAWLKDLAPSTELRKWFNHDPAKWSAFQRRYAAELDARRPLWQELLAAAGKQPLTLLYAARDQEHNNAVALRDYLLARRRSRR